LNDLENCFSSGTLAILPLPPSLQLFSLFLQHFWHICY